MLRGGPYLLNRYSRLLFTADETTKNAGNNVVNEISAISPTISHLPGVNLRPTLAANALVLPPRHETNLSEHDAKHEHKQQHAQGAGIAQVVREKRLAVNMVFDQGRGVARPAVGHHVNKGEQ